jgi:hypothetical protein
VFWKLSASYYVDRSDNELSVAAVLGSDPSGGGQTVRQKPKHGKSDTLTIRKITEEEDED